MSRSTDAASVALPVEKDCALITSVLPYVNGKPHLGNLLGSCLPADVYARYCRVRDSQAIIVGGTNILNAMTILQGMGPCHSPKEYDDGCHGGGAGIYEWLRISFDVLVETTTEPETNITHQRIRKLTQIDTPRSWTTLANFPIIEHQHTDMNITTDSSILDILNGCARSNGVPIDVWRYHLLSQRLDNGTFDFNWNELIDSNNSILVGNLGKFVFRTLKYLKDQYNGFMVGHGSWNRLEAYDALKADVNILLTQYLQHLEASQFEAGLRVVMQISDLGNRFLEANNIDIEPRQKRYSHCRETIGLAVNLVHLLAALIAPYMPAIAASINLQLGLDMMLIPDYWTGNSVPLRHRFGEVTHLFSQIHPDKAAEWKAISKSTKPGSQVKTTSAKMAKKELKKNWWKPTQPDLATSNDILPPMLK